jgi:hypothetical protein
MDSVSLMREPGYERHIDKYEGNEAFCSKKLISELAQPLQYRVGMNGIGVTRAGRAFLRTSTASAVPFL